MSKSKLTGAALDEAELYLMAENYRRAQEEAKIAEEKKATARNDFMGILSTVAYERLTPEIQVVDIHIDDMDQFKGDARAWAAWQYPEYVIENIVTVDGENYTITLLENLELKKYEFTYNGFKYGRTLSLKGADFDAEQFWAAIPSSGLEPDIQDALEDVILEETRVIYSLDEKAAVDLMAECPETVPLFQKFSFRGKPQVSLLPITKVKTEQEIEASV